MKKRTVSILYRLTCLLIVVSFTASCKKYLDAKSNSKLVVPTKLEELQGILDNSLKVNQSDNSAAEASSDNYYITDGDYQGLAADAYRNLYTWGKGQEFISGNNDWSNIYDNVFRANTVLDNLPKIKIEGTELIAADNVKGQALFLRARCLLQALFVWAPAYDDGTAAQDAGIPLRLTSDVNEKIYRPSVGAGYERVLSDLKDAASLLPGNQVSTMRANKAAALGLVARTYLSMRNYDSCFKYSDLALQVNNQVYDYNLITNVSATYPLPAFNQNPEIAYNASMQSIPLVLNTRAKIDSVLYQSYDNNDLRKSLFFKNNGNGSFGFRGSYERSSALFDGVATDELYLMRAECFARLGNIGAAMNDLNSLLKKRWKAGMFSDLTATSAAEALNIILTERRKELIMRGLRWMDIKRFNKEGQDIILKRVILGQTYTLEPNSVRYSLTIPDDVISISGMKQNPR
ncbi:MAG TPA: RagB/SusD family nutrient uptake outer membrane protein [Flavisolibacter sp.]|nr:RagB/SusD family nutrient uptake outer membrane protein [Flavisolibacter sp.]